MTVPVETPNNGGVFGDGVNKTFPVSFQVSGLTNFKVFQFDSLTQVATELTQGTQWTYVVPEDIEVTGSIQGGDIVLDDDYDAPVATDGIYIFRDTPTNQTLDLLFEGSLSSAALEGALDNGVYSAQENETANTQVYADIGVVVLPRGPKGDTGATGAPGTDGTDGTNGTNGTNGTDGKDGKDGTDGKDGSGVPAGGITGQTLTKLSDTDADVGWEDIPQGLPTGGTPDQIIVKQSIVDGDATWEDQAPSLPTGGTQGQVLTKQSSTEGDADWETRILESTDPVFGSEALTTDDGQKLMRLLEGDNIELIRTPSKGYFRISSETDPAIVTQLDNTTAQADKAMGFVGEITAELAGGVYLPATSLCQSHSGNTFYGASSSAGNLANVAYTYRDNLTNRNYTKVLERSPTDPTGFTEVFSTYSRDMSVNSYVSISDDGNYGVLYDPRNDLLTRFDNESGSWQKTWFISPSSGSGAYRISAISDSGQWVTYINNNNQLRLTEFTGSDYVLRDTSAVPASPEYDLTFGFMRMSGDASKLIIGSNNWIREYDTSGGDLSSFSEVFVSVTIGGTIADHCGDVSIDMSRVALITASAGNVETFLTLYDMDQSSTLASVSLGAAAGSVARFLDNDTLIVSDPDFLGGIGAINLFRFNGVGFDVETLANPVPVAGTNWGLGAIRGGENTITSFARLDPTCTTPGTFISAHRYDALTLALPRGGDAGEVLTKVSSADGAAAWVEPPPPPQIGRQLTFAEQLGFFSFRNGWHLKAEDVNHIVEYPDRYQIQVIFRNDVSQGVGDVAFYTENLTHSFVPVACQGPQTSPYFSQVVGTTIALVLVIGSGAWIMASYVAYKVNP